MKTKKLVLLALLLVAICPAYSQFARSVGGTNEDYGYSLVQTSDGGFAVAGRTESFGAGVTDFLLVKFTSTGALQWSRTVGGTDDDYGNSVVNTNDGGFALVGWTESFGAGSNDLLLIKLTSTGTMEWSRAVGGASRDNSYSVTQTSDGGFAVTGWTETFGPGTKGLFIMKFTSAGALQWSRTVGSSSEEGGNSVAQTTDGGFVVAGYTWGFGEGWSNLFLVKLTSAGELEWSRVIGGTNSDYGTCVVQASDGGFAIAGYTRSFGAGGSDLFFVKLNSAGNLEWSRAVGGTSDDAGSSVVQAGDGGFVVAGDTRSFGAGASDLFIVKFSSAGNLQWSRVAGGTDDDRGYSVVQASDGGFAVAGFTESFGSGSNAFLLVKFAADGNTCFGESVSPVVTNIVPTFTDATPTFSTITPTVANVSPVVNLVSPLFTEICTGLDIHETVITPSATELKVFPNPFNASVAIFAPHDATIEIFDINGTRITTLPKNATIWTPEKNIGSGVFFIRTTTKNGQTSAKKIMYVR